MAKSDYTLVKYEVGYDFLKCEPIYVYHEVPTNRQDWKNQRRK